METFRVQTEACPRFVYLDCRTLTFSHGVKWRRVEGHVVSVIAIWRFLTTVLSVMNYFLINLLLLPNLFTSISQCIYFCLLMNLLLFPNVFTAFSVCIFYFLISLLLIRNEFPLPNEFTCFLMNILLPNKFTSNFLYLCILNYSL